MPALVTSLNPVLEETLKSLEHFVYFPNPGNLGDELIAVATLQQFDKLGLSYEIYNEEKQYPEGFTLVYGGGGGMIPDWGFLPTIEKAFMTPGLARGVILPHSLRDCDSLLQRFDERFTIFCREQKSWEYCRSVNQKASIYLADDMGCLLNPNMIPTQKSLHAKLPKPGLLSWGFSLIFGNRRSKVRILHRYYRKTYHRLNRHAKERTTLLPDGRKLGMMMRRDSEAVSGCLPPLLQALPTVDASRYGGANCRWPLFNLLGVRQFLDTISKFDIIVTDRLHASIAAAHLGKEVVMIDNSYGKLSGVWQQSLQHVKHCHLCRSADDVTRALDALQVDIQHIGTQTAFPQPPLPTPITQEYPENYGSIQLSVIVPVYNAEKYLQKCMQSLAAQKCRGIEFICVNDGSKDSSLRILQSWAAADKRFRILNQENQGYGKAMNNGLQAAKGTYIGIVEPDDWIEANMYETLMGFANQTQADIIKSDYFIERNSTSKISEKMEDVLDGATLPPSRLPEYLAGAPSIWTAIYNREWLEQNDIRFSETPGASFQDLGFCIRTWLAARSITATQQAFYHYKEDNPTSSIRRMEDGAWAAFRELDLLANVFNLIPKDASYVRSHIVLRIFATLRADYRLRIRDTVKSFLLKYSHLLNDYFPLDTLQQDVFSKDEWFDVQLMYNTPLLFPRKSRTRANILQRICSIRKEAGQIVIRILGISYVLKKKKKRMQEPVIPHPLPDTTSKTLAKQQQVE